MITSGIYLGTITEAYNPEHESNESAGYQYIYEVVVATDKFSYLPVRCVKMDAMAGGVFNYEDIILGVGQQVFIAFPFSDTSRGVILGGSREEAESQFIDEGSGIRWKMRFNEIDQSISYKGVWTLGHVSKNKTKGPSYYLDDKSILIDDGGVSGDGSESQFIKLDAENNKIEISSGEWTVTVAKGATLNVDGDVNLTCDNAVVDAKSSVSVKTKAADVSIESGVNINIKAKGVANVEATQIRHNSNGVPLDGVLTMTTQPTCYVTGIPFKGSTTVLAGK